MTSSSQPAAVGPYLARYHFAPNPGNPTWLDRATGQQIIRVLQEPGETTFLYCLDSHGACLYEARFTPGTPDAVITAAIDAALSWPAPKGGRARQAPGTAAHSEESGEPR